MTASELVAVFNEVANTPAELKALLNQSGVKEKLRERLRAFQARAAQRLSDLQGQIDTLNSTYNVAIAEAESGADPVNVPTTAAEDAALA